MRWTSDEQIQKIMISLKLTTKNIYFLHVTINPNTVIERDGFKQAYKNTTLVQNKRYWIHECLWL